MGFLDNSGDIILDAVLTDTGRKRLAQGDGSFKITKFALGDDEIDYGLYDSNNPSGSAYYDLEIQPKKGKTLIWPAEWTHAHRGNIVEAGSKYIITGWMTFLI